MNNENEPLSPMIDNLIYNDKNPRKSRNIKKENKILETDSHSLRIRNLLQMEIKSIQIRKPNNSTLPILNLPEDFEFVQSYPT